MSRGGGELLELLSDVCRCIQVAESSDGPVEAHLELNLQQEGKASLGNTSRANRAFMLSKFGCGHWDSACHPCSPRGAGWLM